MNKLAAFINQSFHYSRRITPKCVTSYQCLSSQHSARQHSLHRRPSACEPFATLWYHLVFFEKNCKRSANYSRKLVLRISKRW